MPEGHTLHRLARDQSEMLVGRKVRVSSPQGRFESEARLIDGVVLRRVEAYGKHLFHWWANDLVGHVHLGLFGKFRVTPGRSAPEPIGAVRMRMRSRDATIDLAGPTACELGTEELRDRIVARLGPDPLRDDAEPKLAIDRMSRSRLPVGALLLDQRVMAGVGNVYRAEVLFVNGIHPMRPGLGCSVDELEAIWETTAAMLRKGVEENRIVTIDPELLAPGRSRRGDSTFAYHRDRCLRCAGAIETVELGGRACYFCPVCQPG